MPDQFEELKSLIARVKDLEHTAAVLEWDQETYMPSGGATPRALQIATVRQLAHEFLTDDRVGDLLANLESRPGEADSLQPAFLRVLRRDYDRATKIPADLVGEISRVSAHAKEAWKSARQQSDFSVFEPHLSELVNLVRQKAEAIGYEERLYDALLDEFEPGMKTREVETAFGEVREGLVPMVESIAAAPPLTDAVLRRRYPRQQQWDFGLSVIRDFGYDFASGRQDESAHPFTTTFSISDVRLTTRLDEQFFSPAFFGTLHEAGHGLYEQGIDVALERTPLADGTSLGMHESQSRLWENLVGRSLPFWEYYFPKAQEAFSPTLDDVALGDFYRAANRVSPSLIRVEADEVTYNLHIMLRFEIENLLFDDQISVGDLPGLWNDRMKSYLGITPDSEANGVLQDIHWSLGAFGYFPTYALGNLMSVQLWNAAREAMPSLRQDIGEGRFLALLSWLRENVHRHGRTRTAGEILETITGSALSAGPWLEYIRSKYSELYGPLS
jgi:carboxypeptidase Taq